MLYSSGILNFAIILLSSSSWTTSASKDQPKNVLFLPVDDFRPEIFAGYGQSHMITPNLDKLVKESLVFQRAYCQQAVCIPSRNSFMTRPELIIHLNLPIIQIFYSQICSLLFNNMSLLFKKKKQKKRTSDNMKDKKVKIA